MTESTSLIDPDLPRAVRARGEAIRLKYSTPQPTTATPPTVDPTTVTPPVETPTPDNPSPARVGRENDPEYWKARFRATEGVLKVQQRENDAALEGLRSQLVTLQGEIRTLKAGATPAEAEINLAEYFTPEEIEQYGEPQCRATVKTTLRTAMKTAKSLIEAELAPIKAREAQTAEDGQKRRMREFKDELTTLHPTWATDDLLQPWRDWLAEADPDSGEIRQHTLNRYTGALNPRGTAMMFKRYAATLAPANTPAPPVAPHGSGGSAAETPEALIPGDPSLKAPTTQEMRAFYTRASIKKPGQPGFVTAEERAAFEKRLLLLNRPR